MWLALTVKKCKGIKKNVIKKQNHTRGLQTVSERNNKLTKMNVILKALFVLAIIIFTQKQSTKSF